MAKRKTTRQIKNKPSFNFKKINLKVLGACLLLGGLLYCLLKPVKPVYESNEYKSKEGNDYQETSFGDLSDKDHLDSSVIRYGQKMDEKSIIEINELLKKALEKLNGKGVAIRGFIIPVDSEGGIVHQFTLMRNIPNCSFCPPPGITDWMNVTAEKGIKLAEVPNSPVLIRGKFQAGVQVQGDELINLYSMTADEVIAGQ